MRNTDGAAQRDWAALVSDCMTAAGMTPASLARRLGVDRVTVWRWSTGRQRVEKLAHVEAFAALFGIPIDEALTAANMRPAQPADEAAAVATDPDVARLLERLADPRTNEATKAYIKRTLQILAAIPDEPAAPATPPSPGRQPRRRAS